jgi:hypothetical protein
MKLPSTRRGWATFGCLGTIALLFACSALGSLGGGTNTSSIQPTASVVPGEVVAELPTLDSVAATLEAGARVEVPATAMPAPTRRPATVAPTAADRISRETLGDEWPLTVDAGVFRCDGMAVLFVAAGETYALNGIARGRMAAKGWRDVEEIWRDNPSIAGLKVDIGPLLDRGLAFCQGA